MITDRFPMRYLLRGSRSLNRLFARAVKDTKGVAAIEFAIMIPLFGLMLVSVTDIGLSVYRKMQVESAAQTGAQYAMVRGFDLSSISGAVTNAQCGRDYRHAFSNKILRLLKHFRRQYRHLRHDVRGRCDGGDLRHRISSSLIHYYLQL